MDGDYEGARQLYRRSLDLNRKRGDELAIGVETTNLGAVELRFGNIDAAVRLWRESVSLAHRTGNRYLLPYPVAGLAKRLPPKATGTGRPVSWARQVVCSKPAGPRWIQLTSRPMSKRSPGPG